VTDQRVAEVVWRTKTFKAADDDGTAVTSDFTP